MKVFTETFLLDLNGEGYVIAVPGRGRVLPFLCWLAVLAGPLFANAGEMESDSIAWGDETLRVEWLVEESFRDEAWQERWVVESQSPSVEAANGQLQIRPTNDDRQQGGVTVWYKQAMPDDLVVRVVATTDPADENNACNLNFFVHAREADDSPLLFGRDGAYKDYHQIPNYIFTFTGGITPGWSRVRQDPGFHLLSDRQDVRAEPGQRYTFLIVISGPRIRYYLNGTLIHNLTVEEPLSGGWFGLRSWYSSVNFESVELGRLIAGES